MRQTSLQMVYELAKKDPRILFIGSDLGGGTLDAMKQEMPDRFLMEGVSEAHIIGMAAGMAMEGKIPYINTIATFLTRRCYEQICLDLCLHKLPVRLIGSGGGLVYAPLGPTHLAIEDISLLRSLPNMCIIAPADAEEMKRLMPHTLEYPGPMYIRLGKGGDPIVTNALSSFEIGKAYVMKEGSDLLLTSTGICLSIVLEAASTLEKNGINCTVLHVPTVKPFDQKTFVEAASRCKAIISVEEHVVTGGLGDTCGDSLLRHGISRPFRKIGIPDEFPHDYGSQTHLMNIYGINENGIISLANKMLR